MYLMGYVNGKEITTSVETEDGRLKGREGGREDQEKVWFASIPPPSIVQMSKRPVNNNKKGNDRSVREEKNA